MNQSNERSRAQAHLACMIPFSRWVEQARPETDLAFAWLAIVDRLISAARLDEKVARRVAEFLEVSVAREVVATLPASARPVWMREACNV